MTEAQTRPPIPLPLRILLGAYFLNAFATVGTVTIVGKQVFDMTGRELDLGAKPCSAWAWAAHPSGHWVIELLK